MLAISPQCALNPASTNLKNMRRFATGLGLTFRYWMQTEVHVYAFSVAANVLLSFFPFLIVMLSFSRRGFCAWRAVAALDLAPRHYFPPSPPPVPLPHPPHTRSLAQACPTLLF